MLNHLIRLDGLFKHLRSDIIHRLIDRILALDHLEVTVAIRPHRPLICHLQLLISAILAALYVIFDLARQAVRLGKGHALHNGLHAGVAPV